MIEGMDMRLLFALLVTLIVFGFVFFICKKMLKSKKEEPIDLNEEDEPIDRSQERDNLIYQINLNARMSGVAQVTDVEKVIDKCIEVNQSIREMSNSEQKLLMSTPDDFERLVSTHLNDFVDVFSKIPLENNEKEIVRFNGVMGQLLTELDQILKDIETKNFNAFTQKSRFMEIRFSDKY